MSTNLCLIFAKFMKIESFYDVFICFAFFMLYVKDKSLFALFYKGYRLLVK